MAIYLRCQNCSSDMTVNSKKCEKCGTPTPKKNKKYKVVVSLKGKRLSRTVDNLSIAKEVEAALKTDITREKFDILQKEVITLNELWAKYLPWAQQNKKTWRNDSYYYEKHLNPEFGEKKLDGITPFDIEGFVVKMKKGHSQRNKPYSAATIKHQLVLLTRLYSVAEKWGLYSGENPCKKIKKPKLNNQVIEFLSEQEVERLLQVLDSWHNKMTVAFILFLLHTGLRRGELFKLQWKDISFDNRTIILRDPKGKIDQTLPLSGEALEILKNVPREFKTPWVFYGKNGQQRQDFKGAWLRVKTAAGLPKSFRLHGLRHHFASSLVSNGISLSTVQTLLCHKDISTTQRYAHLADKALRDAVNLSDDLLKPKKSAEIIEINGARQVK